MRKKRKERKGKGRYHKVTRRYISAIRGADTPGPILTKFGVLVAPHDVIKMSNFVVKFSGISDLQGPKSPFPVDFAGHHYNSAPLPRSL